MKDDYEKGKTKKKKNSSSYSAAAPRFVVALSDRGQVTSPSPSTHNITVAVSDVRNRSPGSSWLGPGNTYRTAGIPHDLCPRLRQYRIVRTRQRAKLARRPIDCRFYESVAHRFSSGPDERASRRRTERVFFPWGSSVIVRSCRISPRLKH